MVANANFNKNLTVKGNSIQMKLGIVGLAGSGKSTVFDALTKQQSDLGQKTEDRIGTVKVPDMRVNSLSQLYQPQKTIHAQVAYYLPGKSGSTLETKNEQSIWTQARDCRALIHILRNFKAFGQEAADPLTDFKRLDQELMLADLVVVEKRLERLQLDSKRGKKGDPEELSLLQTCLESLEQEIPLRKLPQVAMSPLLRGFAFLSAKPMLVLFNNEDEDDQLPQIETLTGQEKCSVIRGKLEQELSQMTDTDAHEFLTEFNITASAMDRVIHASYQLLGLISFFTVGDDEVRAWTITQGTLAVDAAGVIHTDMKKGFIRAEVVAYNDLMDAGTYAAARKLGTVRLEGKTYQVQDGDIISVRFNV
jgi:GTP-binding protein YchF